MGKILIVLSDNVERQLRLAAVVRFGGKMGALSGAVEEAVIDWLKKGHWQKAGRKGGRSVT